MSTNSKLTNGISSTNNASNYLVVSFGKNSHVPPTLNEDGEYWGDRPAYLETFGEHNPAILWDGAGEFTADITAYLEPDQGFKVHGSDYEFEVVLNRIGDSDRFTMDTGEGDSFTQFQQGLSLTFKQDDDNQYSVWTALVEPSQISEGFSIPHDGVVIATDNASEWVWSLTSANEMTNDYEP